MKFISTIILLTLISCNNSDLEIIKIPIDKTTIPKGIVVNPKNNDIYISSLHLDQLVRYNEIQNKTEIILNREDHGYSAGTDLGIYKNRLYALGRYNRDSFAMLFIKNLYTDLTLSYKVNSHDRTFFNNLAIDKKGNCYISDTDHHRIYKYDNENRDIRVFYLNEQIENPNGISISSDQTKLFVDSYSHGIRIIDIESKTIVNKLHSPTAQWGVGGIKYHKGKIFFIVNGIKDKSQHGLYSLDLIENETEFGNLDPVLVFHKKMHIPTTLSIVHNQFYMLANSQLDLLEANTNTIIDSSKLTDTYVIKKMDIHKNQ